MDISIDNFIKSKNDKKRIFTAGPASLAIENIIGLEPCFGRDDESYDKIETEVLDNLKSISGHQFIARMQGSGSMALEVMITNFAFGRVLVVDTGYYAQRAKMMAKVASDTIGHISKVEVVYWSDLEEVCGSYDWVFACYTETSIGLKLCINHLSKLAKKVGAKLMLDATASIGLESDHNLADVISYSSCKGLFGLTGAGFVAFNEHPSLEVSSFALSLNSHFERKMTGPYHAICSLLEILRKHDEFKYAVSICKEDFVGRFKERVYFPKKLQPQLCTRVRGIINSDASNAILYKPRSLLQNESVVCHLGEIHLGLNSSGNINESLTIN